MENKSRYSARRTLDNDIATQRKEVMITGFEEICVRCSESGITSATRRAQREAHNTSLSFHRDTGTWQTVLAVVGAVDGESLKSFLA